MQLKWSFVSSVVIGQPSNTTSSSRIHGRPMPLLSVCMLWSLQCHNSQFICCGIIVSWSLQHRLNTSWSWSEMWSTSAVIRTLLGRWYEMVL
jgi:hypothetical protein